MGGWRESRACGRFSRDAKGNVIGCIKTSKTAAAFATTGLALKLYRRHFGVVPVAVTRAPDPLDVVAAWTEDRKRLTVAIVNPTRGPLALSIEVKGATLTGTGRVWQITGPDATAYNEPGRPPGVVIEEKQIAGISGTLVAAPISVTLYELAVR